MKSRYGLGLIACIAWSLFGASSASAATCVLNGTIKYEPRDYYYCDTDHMSSCSSWQAVDLDKKRTANNSAVPMPHMKVEIRPTANGAPLKTVYTNSSGAFSASLTLAACAGTTVYVSPVYWRRHETDTTRFRFRITDALDRTVSAALSAPLTGATTTWSYTMPATSSTQTARRFAVYYTLNSALTEIATWSTNLSSGLSGTTTANIQPVVVDSTYVDGSYAEANPGDIGRLWIDYADYASGQTLRHELGHWVHAVAHHELQKATCLDYKYPGAGDEGHDVNTCEFGFVATTEAMATFIAARSITSTDTNVWACWIQDGDQDLCSEEVDARTDDTDNDGIVPGRYEILGDIYANTKARCAVPEATTCSCGAACNTQAQKDSKGFRIETQIERFFWDMLDTSTDSGSDDTDLTIGQFIAAMEAMDCSSSAVDGDCNEPNTSPCSNASRDRYNAYDYGDAIAGDQAAERGLNCVSGAPD